MKKYTYFIFFFCSILFALIFSQTPAFHDVMFLLNKLGYLGVFITGIFFVSTFTIATATVVLISFLGTMSPLEISIFGGLGATLGNLLLLYLIKHHLLKKNVSLFKFFKKKSRKHIHHAVFYHWSLPALGALILASPLPDEIGIALISILHMKTYQFMIVSYLLKTTGIFLILNVPLITKV